MILDFLRLNKETKMKYWQLIVLVVLVTIVAPLSVTYVQTQIIHAEPTVEEIVEKGHVVVETLRTMMDRYNASRIYLGRFYNGTFFTDGDPLARWVVTHQVVNNTVTNLPPEFTEFPVTFLADAFNTISNGGYVTYHTIESNRGVVYNIMRAEDMKSLYMFSVHDPQGNMIAAVVMEFRKNRVLDMDETQEMLTTMQRLSGFIMYE